MVVGFTVRVATTIPRLTYIAACFTIEPGSSISILQVKAIVDEIELAGHGSYAFYVNGGIIHLSSGCIIQINGGKTQAGAIRIERNGILQLNRNIVVSGNGYAFIDVFSKGFFYRSASYDPIITGSFIGQRYRVKEFGQITTHGGGANYFPGTIAGALMSASYGLYI